jgi:hypothetical protein
MGRLTGIHRRQDAVLWAVAGRDKYSAPKVSSPIALKVRWLDKQTETLDADNNVIQSDVMVKANREIKIGSILWKGKLADVPSPATDLYQVIQSRSVTNIKNRETRYTVFLIRYSNTLPTVV